MVDPDEEVEVPNSKNAKATVLIKFPGDKQPSSLRVLKPGEEKKIITRVQTGEDTGLVPLIAFECRGLEPVRWHPSGPYCVETEGGTTYEDVNFREGDDWCEYDEKSGESLTVGKDIKYEFRRG